MWPLYLKQSYCITKKVRIYSCQIRKFYICVAFKKSNMYIIFWNVKLKRHTVKSKSQHLLEILMAMPQLPSILSRHVCISWPDPFGQGWTDCLCCMMVVVYCYTIHFTIFLFSAPLCSISQERSNPINYMSQAPLPPWLQLGSADGRCW